MDPITMMIVGTGVNVFAQWAGNYAQAQAEAQNARFYAQQERFAILSMERELQVSARNYAYQTGKTVSAFAGGGVDVGSGSAADVIARSVTDAKLEADAIREKGRMNILLARSRASRSQQLADTLQSVPYNLMQAGGTVLTNASKDKEFAGALGFY